MVRELCIFCWDKPVNLAWFKMVIKNADDQIDISHFLAGSHLNVRFEYLAEMEGPTFEYVVFSQISQNFDIEKLVKELREHDKVIDISWEVANNVSFHSTEFPLELMGERAIITRATTFVDILKILNEYTTQSSTLLFLSGLRGGSNAAKYFIKTTELNRYNMIAKITELFLVAGWGKLEIDFDIETLKGTIKVKDSFIADTLGISESQVCGYMSGYFSGFFSQVLDMNMYVSETACKSMGNPHCEHSIYKAPHGKIEHLIRGDVT